MLNLLLSTELNIVIFTFIIFFVGLFFKLYETNNYKFTYILSMLLLINLSLGILFFPANYAIFEEFYFTTSSNTWLIKVSTLFLFGVFYSFANNHNYGITQFQPERHFFTQLVLISSLLITTANDFIMAFILLELVGITSYVIIAMSKTRYSYEAAVKYLFFSAFGTLFLVLANASLGLYFRYHEFATALLAITITGNLSYFDLSQLILLCSFIVKLGIGPFFNWVADVYEASDFPTFVILATIGKLPLVFLITNIGLTYNYFCKIIIVCLLLASAVSSVILIIYQQKIRRFFAYSGVFNYSLGFLTLFFSSYTNSYFLKFFIYYIFASIILYVAFDNYKQISSEIKTASELSKYANNAFAKWFGLALTFSTGLPPAGLFIAKAYVLGSFVSLYPEAIWAEQFIILITAAFTYFFLSVFGLFAYIKLMGKIFNFENSIMQSAGRHHGQPENREITPLYFMFIVFIAVNVYWLFFVQY
jgi:NADH:ubiquinone oxidoreductase subunit 2 (subunit N)